VRERQIGGASFDMDGDCSGRRRATHLGLIAAKAMARSASNACYTLQYAIFVGTRSLDLCRSLPLSWTEDDLTSLSRRRPGPKVVAPTQPQINLDPGPRSRSPGMTKPFSDRCDPAGLALGRLRGLLVPLGEIQHHRVGRPAV